jgi:hypothetical protein
MLFLEKRLPENQLDDAPLGSKYFFKLFKRKEKKPKFDNAISPEKLKKLIDQAGVGKKVNITRMTYDGTPEDKPIAIKIIDIRDDHFTGKVINVERSIKQSENNSIVYVKGGGGSIDFYFNDGDIMSVEEDIDQTVMEQRNVEEIKEILDALDLNEDIIISYYDDSEGGVMNGVGKLLEKNMESLDFKVELTKINEIEMGKPHELQLNLNKNKIIDLEVQI